MDFITAARTCLGKSFTFSGRASRSEYWWFYLFGIIIKTVTGFIPVFGTLVYLALLIPWSSVSVRRLHDTDRSGVFYWILLGLIAVFVGVRAVEGGTELGPLALAVCLIAVGWLLMLIVWFCQRGTDGPNRFGADPLAHDPEA